MGIVRKEYGTVINKKQQNDQVGAINATDLAATGNQELDASGASVFEIAPTADLTLSIANAIRGQRISIVVRQTTTTSRTITFGTGFKATGTLATVTTADRAFVMDFIKGSDGVMEVSRTAAIDIS